MYNRARLNSKQSGDRTVILTVANSDCVCRIPRARGKIYNVSRFFSRYGSHTAPSISLGCSDLETSIVEANLSETNCWTKWQVELNSLKWLINSLIVDSLLNDQPSTISRSTKSRLRVDYLSDLSHSRSTPSTKIFVHFQFGYLDRENLLKFDRKLFPRRKFVKIERNCFPGRSVRDWRSTKYITGIIRILLVVFRVNSHRLRTIFRNTALALWS